MKAMKKNGEITEDDLKSAEKGHPKPYRQYIAEIDNY